MTFGSKRMTTCKEGMLALEAVIIYAAFLIVSGVIHAETHDVPYHMVPSNSISSSSNITNATTASPMNNSWEPVVDPQEYQLARFCLDMIIVVACVFR